MTVSLEQIDQDLEGLRATAQALTQSGQRYYQAYLKLLGRAVRQQMVMATYHVCTQIYPDSFLQLSASERLRFQAKLKQLAQQTDAALRDCWSVPPTMDFPIVDFDLSATPTEPTIASADNLLTDWLPQAIWPVPVEMSSTVAGEPLAASAVPPAELPVVDLPSPDLLDTGLLDSGLLDAGLLETELPEPDWSVMPSVKEVLEELKQSQANAEAQIAEILHKTSKDLDQHLQVTKILPATPLERVLEIAAKAEAVGRPVTRPPNLLTAMVEPQSERTLDHPPSEAAVIAVYLQLGEIEFNDPALMNARNQLRKFSAQLEKLEQRVQKKMQDRQTLMAVNAWQATWRELR
jgi:hypothetical protein